MKLIIPEREVQRTGIAVMRSLGVKLYRRNVAFARAEYNGKKRIIRCGESGQSDTYGWVIATGRHVEIEWKRLGERPTLEQVEWLIRCSVDGAIAFWADNVPTAEQVMKTILAGGRIGYRDNLKRYGKQWGRSGDYDVYIDKSQSSELQVYMK